MSVYFLSSIKKGIAVVDSPIEAFFLVLPSSFPCADSVLLVLSALETVVAG
jgi:hypothetical protein